MPQLIGIKMRLFIAINLNNEMKDALLDLQGDIMNLGVGGNYTRPENLHLTLAFIGEFSDPDLVKEVVDRVWFEPFDVAFAGAGSFRNLWWVGIEKNDALANLVRRLRRGLADAGIPFDRKKFSPHITVIRRPDRPLDEVLGSLQIPKARMTVDHISLMRSDRGKNGMIYTEL